MKDVEKIKNIVYDLEKNESILDEEDSNIIKEAGKNIGVGGNFNEDLYNFFYNSKNKYPQDFFLNKKIYDGETISKGIFAISCLIFEAKKKYLRTRVLWEIN